uniref:Inhibitor of nuclear factor-kappaB protein n=1 Tax=Pinctada fucata TaxID=50426 RepID=B5AS35_PINFU|nr:inhibitor of nuclear factor-kappaB protein [Pinctada fucata]
MSDMDVNDLEIDGAPLIHERPKLREVDLHDTKYDSGFSSFGSMRSTDTRSVDSVDGAGFLHLKGVVTPSLELTDKFKDLSVVPEDKKVPEKYDSIERTFDSGIGNSISSQEAEADPASMQLAPDVFDLFQQDADGDSQLHIAIINLLTPIAMYIISRAPHPDWLNLPNNLLQTPLHLAVMTRMPEVVRMLMVAGADVDPRDNKGDTPLHIACREGYDEIVEILMDPVKHQETQLNKYKITYQKIPQDLESRNYNGQTCLHVAAEGTHLPCIRLLVKKGANSNAADGKSGRTALHYAAESGNRILLEFLLQNPKVSVHAKTYAGLTPIMLAVGRGFGDIVMRLRQSGAIIESIAGEESESDEDMS